MSVIIDVIKLIHMNLILCFIFHIPASIQKLKAENIVNNENIAQYDNNVPEKANLVPNNVYPISFHRGIIKQHIISMDIVRYV